MRLYNADRCYHINHHLVMLDCERAGGEASTAAAVIDSQTVKTNESGGVTGYDGGNLCVVWKVVAGPDAWMGTTVRFDLARDDDFTAILFTHQGWNEQSEFMHHCTTKRGMFLMSLKTLLETGRGSPFPDDVQISNKGG